MINQHILVGICLEANAHYTTMSARYRAGCNRLNTLPEVTNTVIAEVYLMRADTLLAEENNV